jgi:AraC-like DNA-binding protein
VTSATVSLGAYGPAVAHYPRGATLGPRTTVDFEFVWMVVGTAGWRRHDNPDERQLTPHNLLLVRPGMRDEFEWDSRAPCTHGYVHFAARTTEATASWPLTRPLTRPGPLGALLSYLLWLADERAANWRERADDVLGTLLRAFVSGPLPDLDRRAEPPALASALDHVRATWTHGMCPVPVGDLASAARVSKGHLTRLFRSHVGYGPAAALELVRLSRSRTLLLRSNLSITQVAHECGFADPLHFSRRFRVAFGVSPRGFRTGGEPGAPPDPPGLRALMRRLG